MLYKILIPVFSLLALAFAVRHVVVADQEPPKLPPPIEPARSPFQGGLAGSGVIEPISENIAVGSPLPGVVAQVFGEVGSDVKKGDKLFRLDDRHLRAELQVRQAMLDSSRASFAKLDASPRKEERPISEAKVRESQALLADAREQFLRADKGYRAGAITEEEYYRKKNLLASVEAQLARAEAELKLFNEGTWEPEKLVAKAQIKLAEAQLRQTETEIERLIVRSPVDGRILQRNVREGEYVGVPPGQPLILVGDMSTLHVRMDVDENDIGRFERELPGVAITRGANKREVTLEFVRIEPLVVPKKSLSGMGTERVDTRVLQVIYKIVGTNPNLFIGQQVDVYLGKRK